jgi:putative polyhydroxyalkanoate system protein
MASLHIVQEHKLGQVKALEKLGTFEDQLKRYRVRATWQGARAKIKGTGVSGSILVTDTEVEISLKLGLLAKAAGIDPIKLEKSIRKRLIAALGGPDSLST